MTWHNFQYDRKVKVQYVVRYLTAGTWRARFFTDSQKAMAFWAIIRASPNVEQVKRVQTLYQ